MDATELERRVEALHEESFAWALSCCHGRRADAEEALQTAYLKLLDGRARFAGRSSFKTWLFAVIRRTAAGERRRRALRRTLGWRQAAERDDTAFAEPIEALSRDQERARVRAAISRLSPRQRQILDLVFYHELTVREAAEVMAIGQGAASVHYHRAKARLAEELKTDDAG